MGVYELSLDPTIQIPMHMIYNNDMNVKYMIKQQILEALKNTGALMSAEEAYSSERAEFVRLAREQALVGLYKSHVDIDTVEVAGGAPAYIKRYSVERDKDGNPIITKESLLAKYNITLPQFNIKDMDFDPKLQALIDSRKDAQKAEQAAITAKAEGEAKIATEKATQEISKIKEVTIAQKEKEVAVLNAQREYEVSALQAKQAGEVAKKIIAQGTAEAETNRLKVNAGLTPQERAEWDYKTKVGVAEKLAGITFPGMMIIGGGSNGQVVNPFDAIGLESFIRINERMAGTGPTKN